MAPAGRAVRLPATMKTLKLIAGLHFAGLVAVLTRSAAHGTATEVAQKWSRNAQQGATDYTAGVNRVTHSPTAAAAAAADTWQARVSSQQARAKFVRKLQGVSLEEWKSRTAQVGAARFAQGVAASESKMEQAMTRLLPFIDNLRSQIKSMPNATLEDRIQRSRAWITGMSQYTGQ